MRRPGAALLAHTAGDPPAIDHGLMALKVTISSPRNVICNVEVKANLGMVDLLMKVLGFGVPTM